MNVFSKRLNKNLEVVPVTKNGEEFLTHETFLNLYQQIKQEVGLTIMPIGTPNTWECLNSVVIPFVAQDSYGNVEYAIGQATMDSIETDIGRKYFANIAYNRGFDKALQLYLQIPKVKTDNSIIDEVVNNDCGIPTGTVNVNTTLGQIEMPTPVPTQYSVPIPTPNLMVAEMESPSASIMPEQPVISNIPVMPVAEQSTVPTVPVMPTISAPITPVDIATAPEVPVMPVMPIATTSMVPVDTSTTPEVPIMPITEQLNANITLDETQPGIGNPGKTVITFGPSAYIQGQNTIETSSLDNLRWIIANIRPDSKFYPIKLDVEAYVAANSIQL